MTVTVNGFSAAELTAIETKTREIGQAIFDHLDRRRPSILQRRWWDDQIMNQAMGDESLKVALFRFVDVLPALRTSDDVVDHLREYLASVWEHVPAAARFALASGSKLSIGRSTIAAAAWRSAMSFARRFIAGTNAREVMAAARRERARQRGFTLDILGEAVTSDAEADRYFHAYCDLMKSIAPDVNGWMLFIKSQ